MSRNKITPLGTSTAAHITGGGASPASVTQCRYAYTCKWSGGRFKPLSRTSKHNSQGVVRRGDYQVAIGARS
jgi:hypothetical protein